MLRAKVPGTFSRDQTCERVPDTFSERRLRAIAAIARAAGAAGIALLREPLRIAPKAKVLIDLNAVPPAGIEGVEPTDRGTDRDALVREEDRWR